MGRGRGAERPCARAGRVEKLEVKTQALGADVAELNEKVAEHDKQAKKFRKDLTRTVLTGFDRGERLADQGERLADQGKRLNVLEQEIAVLQSKADAQGATIDAHGKQIGMQAEKQAETDAQLANLHAKLGKYVKKFERCVRELVAQGVRVNDHNIKKADAIKQKARRLRHPPTDPCLTATRSTAQICTLIDRVETDLNNQDKRITDVSQ